MKHSPKPDANSQHLFLTFQNKESLTALAEGMADFVNQVYPDSGDSVYPMLAGALRPKWAGFGHAQPLEDRFKGCVPRSKENASLTRMQARYLAMRNLIVSAMNGIAESVEWPHLEVEANLTPEETRRLEALRRLELALHNLDKLAHEAGIKTRSGVALSSIAMSCLSY